MPKQVNIKFDYKPINRQQQEFHQSKAQHKLLIGGYGSGKTYPAIHESLFICLDNPGHEFLVCRNTWDSLTENVEKEFLQVAEDSGVGLDPETGRLNYNKTTHDLTLINGTTVRFRPLTLSRAQFKGLNICGFFIDDPDVTRYHDIISFLFTRLRNSPRAKAKYFKTIITANYEGHNWLWRTYIKGHDQGGDEKFAYWICPTKDNPTLPDDFIDNLRMIHSDSWIKRFVECDMTSYAGLIYDEYDPDVHDRDLTWIWNRDQEGNLVSDKAEALIKVMVIDTGITDPDVVLKMACDYNNVYVYDEYYRPNTRANVLGEYLDRERNKDNFRAMIMDKSANKTEKVTGQSVEGFLRSEYHIHTMPSVGKIEWGIETVKTMLTPIDGTPHMFIDPIRCPMTIKELELYCWKEPEMSEFDELAYKENPVDRDNHCMDCLRYGSTYFRRFMRGMFLGEKTKEEQKREYWRERRAKLKLYKDMDIEVMDPETQRMVDAHQRRRGRVKYKYNRSGSYKPRPRDAKPIYEL